MAPVKLKENMTNEVQATLESSRASSGSGPDQSRKRTSSNSKRMSGERDADNIPPHSRLFVVCGRQMTEDELVQVFENYGEVEYCRMILDKATNEPKGVCYIKFSRASSAAAAVETLDGACLYEHSSPIRVQVADAKGSGKNGKRLTYSKEPEDTPARSRLFVVCPKDMSERQMTEYFDQFAGLEYCKVITDKISGESKGFAYVKFNKASCAALAMEAVTDAGHIGSMKVKALIADPKVKRADQDSSYRNARPVSHVIHPPYSGYQQNPYYSAPPMMGTTYYSIQEPRLLVVCHTSVSQDELVRLFQQVPGMEFCQLFMTPEGESSGVAHVTYATVAAADQARQTFDASEFPEGWTLSVRFFDQEQQGTPPSSPPAPMMWMSPPPRMPYMMGVMPPQHMGELFPVYEPKVSFQFSGEPLTEAKVADTFQQFGSLDYYHLETDYSGIVAFASQNAAFNAQRELHGREVEDGIWSVLVMQSMPYSIPMSISPPGYPPAMYVPPTQFSLEW